MLQTELTNERLELLKPDLTDLANGIHAINLIVDTIAAALKTSGYPNPKILHLLQSQPLPITLITSLVQKTTY